MGKQKLKLGEINDAGEGLSYMFDIGNRPFCVDLHGWFQCLADNTQQFKKRFKRAGEPSLANDNLFEMFPEFKPFFPVSMGGTRAE
jgi:hypothetical protein